MRMNVHERQMVGNSFCMYNVRSLISLLCIFCLYLHNTSEAQINSTPDDLVEIFRVGDEADGDTILFRNHEHAEVAVDNSGRFFVGGWQEAPVIAFSEKGDFIGYVGDLGEAPGEFENSSSVTIGSNGQIYVFDFDSGKLSAFEPELFQFSHSNRISNPMNLFQPNKLLGMSENGYFFKYITSHWMPDDPERGYKPEESRFEFVKLVDDSGSIVMDSVAKLPASQFGVTVYSDEDLSSMSVYPLPFGRKPFFAFKNGLIYAGWNDMVDISVISEDGEIIHTVRINHKAKPVTRKELRSKMSGRSRRERRDIQKSKLLSDTTPAYDVMVIDDDGNIWIREYPDFKSELTKWMIIDPNSNVIGEIELPTSVLLKTIKAGRAYASVNPEEYGPYIAVYSVKNK